MQRQTAVAHKRYVFRIMDDNTKRSTYFDDSMTLFVKAIIAELETMSENVELIDAIIDACDADDVDDIDLPHILHLRVLSDAFLFGERR